MSINCRKLALTVFFPAVFAAASSGQDAAYAALYPNECRYAEEFYSLHKSLFEQAAQNAGFEPQMLFAIAAPELTQYNYLSNKLETYSLKVFYVQHGKAYSDFSIGCFQMKPSFVELLEETAAADLVLKTKYAACLFDAPDERAARVTRIDRLGTIEWQLTYLSLFCEIVQKRFGSLSFAGREEQLRFYAAAYNCGFHKSEQQIKDMMQKSLFPRFSQQKFNYSEIAVWFYRKIFETQYQG